MKKFLFVICFIMFSSAAIFANDVVTSANGGNWNNPASWIDNKVPDKDDNVTITSEIIVDSEVLCKNLIIEKDASIQIVSNKMLVSENLTLFGKFTIHKNAFLSILGQFKREDNSEITNNGIIQVGQ